MVDELSGALSERVAVEVWTEGRDDAGAAVGHWAAQGFAWAAVVPEGGGGLEGGVEGAARRSRRRWRVTLRAPLAVQLTSRLIWRNSILVVLAVENDPRLPDRVVLRCEAREG